MSKETYYRDKRDLLTYLIAIVQFGVGLFDDRNPKFSGIGAARQQEMPLWSARKAIVDRY